MKCPHCGEEISDKDFMPVIISSGVEFEQFLCDKINAQDGMHCEMTKASGDQGVDLIAYVADKKIAIQCKLYSEPVGNSAVQEVLAGRILYKCDIGCVVTNSSYTSSAKELAAGTGILLLDYRDVLDYLKSMVLGDTAAAEELIRKRQFDDAPGMEQKLLAELKPCRGRERVASLVNFAVNIGKLVLAHAEFEPVDESYKYLTELCLHIGIALTDDSDKTRAEMWLRMACEMAKKLRDRQRYEIAYQYAEKALMSRRAAAGYRLGRDEQRVLPENIDDLPVLFDCLVRLASPLLEGNPEEAKTE